MSKITEERMREIIEKSFEKHTCQLDDNGYHTAVDEDEFPEMLDDIVGHPEIKGLFEGGDELHECDMCRRDFIHGSDEPYSAIFPNGDDKIYLCSKNCVEIHLGALDNTESSCKEIVDNSIEPEYEVIEYSLTGFGNLSMSCKRYNGVKVCSATCTEHCKTNGKQNFKGHEVEGKSVRCAHRFNGGGEG
jgi:hypothetical protein